MLMESAVGDGEGTPVKLIVNHKVCDLSNGQTINY